VMLNELRPATLQESVWAVDSCG